MEETIEAVVSHMEHLPLSKRESVLDYVRFISQRETIEELDDYDYELLARAKTYDITDTVSLEELLEKWEIEHDTLQN